MVAIDPYSAGFAMATLVAVVAMTGSSFLGWAYSRDLRAVILANLLVGLIMVFVFPSIVVGFG